MRARPVRPLGFVEDQHIAIHVPGKPTPKARARAYVRKYGKKKGTIGHYTPKDTAEWEHRAARLFADSVKKAGPLLGQCIAITIEIFMRRPKSKPDLVPLEVWKTGEACWAGVKPDRDNIEKAVQDATNRSRDLFGQPVWDDDSRVVLWDGLKMYAAKGEKEHVRIYINPIQW